MSRRIHVYPFVARNHGGIPFSGVCPKKTTGIKEPRWLVERTCTKIHIHTIYKVLHEQQATHNTVATPVLQRMQML